MKHWAICDACDEFIRSARYKCVQCEDFDLCEACFRAGRDRVLRKKAVVQQDEDVLMVVKAPRVYEEDTSQAHRLGEHLAMRHDFVVAHTPLHVGGELEPAPQRWRRAEDGAMCLIDLVSVCASCGETPQGESAGAAGWFRCAQCPDVVLCSTCGILDAHEAPHVLIHVQDAPAHLSPLRAEQSNWKALGLPLPNVVLDSGRFGYGVYQRQGRSIHAALCDGCDCRILGVRFKCSVCDDFDFCSTCYANHVAVGSDHDKVHLFYRITRPISVMVDSTLKIKSPSDASLAFPYDVRRLSRGGWREPPEQGDVLDAIYHIERSVFKDLSWGEYEFFSSIKASDHFTFVALRQDSEADEADRVAGYAMLVIERTPALAMITEDGDGDETPTSTCNLPGNTPGMHVVSIAVHPDCRGQGIGTRLMQTAMSELLRVEPKKASERPAYARLHVQVDNRARLLYEKLGFKEQALIPHYYGYGDDGDAFAMLAPLQCPPPCT